MSAPSMIWYKLWLETRLRFLLASALVLTSALLFVVMQRHYYPLYLHRFSGRTYAQYIYWNVSTYPRGLYQFVGFIIGLSGWQRERSVGNLGFSLALPRSRTEQIFDRALFEAVQMAVIAFGSLLSVWALATVLGHSVSLGLLLLFAVCWTIGGWFVYALTFLCSVICPNEYSAIAASYILYMVLLMVVQQSSMRQYSLNDVALMKGDFVIDPHTMLWNGHIPVAIFAGHLAAAAALIVIAVAIVKYQEL